MFVSIYPPPQENIEPMFESIFVQNLDSVGFTGIFKYEMSVESTKDKYEMNTKYKSTLQNSYCYFDTLAPDGLFYGLKQR